MSDIRHPAKFTDTLLPEMADMIGPCIDADPFRILDPFAGTGKIHRLRSLLPVYTDGIEIEREWCNLDPRTTYGDALDLPWRDGWYHAIVTSPAYGNRMADHHEARDGSTRNTYRHALGRALHSHNSGAMQWGAKYRKFHDQAWCEARRVLADGGLFLLNIKDHIRGGARQYVTDWHVETLCALGFVVVEHRRVECPGNGFGQNGARRVPYESLILFSLPADPPNPH